MPTCRFANRKYRTAWKGSVAYLCRFCSVGDRWCRLIDVPLGTAGLVPQPLFCKLYQTGNCRSVTHRCSADTSPWNAVRPAKDRFRFAAQNKAVVITSLLQCLPSQRRASPTSELQWRLHIFLQAVSWLVLFVPTSTGQIMLRTWKFQHSFNTKFSVFFFGGGGRTGGERKLWT